MLQHHDAIEAAVPLPILSWIASYHLPIPCGLTEMFPCDKGKG
ncbi:hypothetical protein CLOSCI_03387 [[Clostridium] scindens ATCC 35704]|nr:hypothetical protein CLOSCI_03387 [[Clostridium] scindens ATCC 35704]